MTSEEKIARLRLIRTDNIGPITFYKLLERFGTAERALKHLPQISKNSKRLADLKIVERDAVLRELEAAEKIGAKIIMRGENEYPKLLAELEDAPPAITVLGDASLLSKPSLGIVGARNASTVGRKITEEFAQKISAAGFVITSGLARGIDTSAHTAALDAGTVAVVAGGIDVVYPKENEKLYREIAERGAIVAESPFGMEPLANHFPKRNRIISGLSLGVLVVEAALKSGSLITARMALEQNREVFAVPGSPKDPRAEGTNKLIKDGAHMALYAEDIIGELRSLRLRPLNDMKDNGLQGSIGIDDNAEIKALDDAVYDAVLSALNFVPVHVDELIRELKFGAGDIATVLLELELAGKITRHIGNKISLA